MKRTACFMSLALLFASTISSYAQVQTFLGDSNASPRDLTGPLATQSSFLAQFPVHGTDNFESYPVDPTFFFGFTPPTLTLNGLSTTYSTNAPIIGSDLGGFPLSVSPKQFLSTTDITGTVLQNISFTFSNSVNAFGVFVAQVGDIANSTQLTITLQDGPSGTPRLYSINNSGDGTGTPTTFSGRQFDATFYFGIFDSTPFDMVTINSNNPNDGFVFDDLSVAAVPEPTTYALIGGIGLVVAGRRYWLKRKQQQQLEGRFKLAR